MKVGINARTFSVDEPGGAVQASIKHAKKLIDRPDTSVILFGHQSINSTFPNNRIENFCYPINSQVYGLIWERTVLPSLVKKHDIDVLYCPNGNVPVSDPACPVVMCIHDVNAIKGWSSSIHQLYRKYAIPNGVEVADKVVTVSRFSKQEIQKSLNVTNENIEIVHNGVDDLFYSEDPGDPLELPDSYFLFVGSMNPRKNIQRVIKAFINFKEKTENSHKLVVIGPDNKTIFKNIDIGNREDIVTPGFVTKRQLKYAYNNAELFLFPSLYEGFGLPPLEAMACGTPVIASNISSLSEVLGDAALLVNPKCTKEISSAIQTILSNESLALSLIKQGQSRAEQFTWEKSNNCLWNILKKFDD